MGQDVSAHDDITRPLATETGFYPDGRAVAVHGTGHSTSTHIDASNRKNDWGPWVAVACILGALSLGASLMQVIMTPQIIDAKVAAGVEQAKAAMAEKAAEAQATANVGREHARIALDKVEQTQVQLGAKGIVFPSTH